MHANDPQTNTFYQVPHLRFTSLLTSEQGHHDEVCSSTILSRVQVFNQLFMDQKSRVLVHCFDDLSEKFAAVIVGMVVANATKVICSCA